MSDVRVTEEPEAERYVVTVDGEHAGHLEYRGRHATRALTHTEVDPRFEGQGVGSVLVRAVFEDLRGKGAHVVPMCPFVQAYLGRHPEDLDLVEPHVRAAFNLPAAA